MQAVSRNFAFCAEGNHKGSGLYKNKNIPDSIGNITFTSSLYFLYYNFYIFGIQTHDRLL